jgi:hypothetical protein
MASVNKDPQVPPIEVRDSKVHGLGVFASRQIEKGERIIEYIGERVSHDEADRRYEEKDENDSHTFLFIVDSRTVIDAGTGGNDARYFNHSCDPNCESVVERRRVFIEALRAIGPGEEMTYDYQIQREDDDPENIDEVFACRCGFPQCRGTMLWPTQRKATRQSKSQSKSKSKSKGKGKGKSATGKKKEQNSAPAKRSAAGKRAGSGKSYAAVKTASKRKSAAGRSSGAGQKSAPRKKSGSGRQAAPGRKSGQKDGSVHKPAKKSVRRR